MSTAIGQTLLNQIIDDLKLEGISGILQSALSFRFGEMHEAGAAFFGNNQLAAVLMANPGVKNALSGAGITNLLAAGNAIGQAKESAFDPTQFTDVDIDTGSVAPSDLVTFDADGGSFKFMDDASIETNVRINNFSSDDVISISNADVDDYSFVQDGTDVSLSYNYMDEGVMNVITLIGVAGNDDLVYDQASFAAAIRFDAFAV
jgi:hypothetical protein